MRRRKPPDLDDLEHEIQDHIETETLENLARGMSEPDARTAALRKFGNVLRVREDVREVWLWIWWDQCRQDARDALRRLRRNPGLAVAIAGTLALGIGVTTAIFSVVNAVLLRPLSYPHPERMVWVTTRDARSSPANDEMPEVMNALDLVDWRAQATSFEQLVAYLFSDATVSAGGQANRWRIMSASDGFWAMSGAQPILGTLPDAKDRQVLVISYRTFRERFDGDPNVIGRAVTVGGEQATIGAVLPADFAPQLVAWGRRPGVEQDHVHAYRGLMMPLPQDRRTATSVLIHLAVGQLKQGVTLEQARAEIGTIHDRIQQAIPAERRAAGRGGNSMFTPTSPVIMPLAEKLTGHTRFPLRLLLAAALCVLLITCANVANVLLSRSSTRQREIALRMSVGGGPWRVIRQLLAESAAFALAGGAAGVLLASWLVNLVVGLLGPAVPRLTETTIDQQVLAFAAGISVLTALVFGLGPAMALSRINVQEVLKTAARHASSSPRMLLVGRASVALQLALTIVLLTAAGLMLKSVWRMTSYPLGFAPEQILTMRLEFSGPAYADTAARYSYADALLARARSLPGVREAALTTDRGALMVIIKEGEQRPENPEWHSAQVSAVSPSFGPLVGMTLLRGSWLSEHDTPDVILINEALARREFPEIDPIGRRIQLPWVDNRGLGTIVGVVRDLKYARIDADASPEVFAHYKSRRLFGITLAFLIDGDPLAAAPTITTALRKIDLTQSLFSVKTMEQTLAESIAPRRFNLLLLATFAIVALVLVALGIYGVVAYAVAERTQEIGIRMALGAERRAVVSMMVRQTMSSVAAGVVAGLLAALLVTRLLETLLYDVAPTDPPTFVVATAALVAIALIASVTPAMKAAFVDPVVALRAE